MRFRFTFADWAPDIEDFGNNGLSVATNVVHDAEGWKDVLLRSANAFSTTIAASVSSVIAKPIGAKDDYLVAWIQGDQNIHIGINGTTGTSPTTGYPISFSTVGTTAITAFDVSELNGYAFFVLTAEMDTAVPATSTTLSFAGYLPI